MTIIMQSQASTTEDRNSENVKCITNNEKGVVTMTEPKTKTKMFTAKVDDDLLKAFKYACENQDTTASQAVRAFMREYVRKHGQIKLI